MAEEHLSSFLSPFPPPPLFPPHSYRRSIPDHDHPMKNSNLPPALIANLQSVLIGRKGESAEEESKADEPQRDAIETSGERKPIVLVTNGDGIESPGLVALVEGLVRGGRYDVYVCAPELDKSVSGHSVTVRETLVASSVELAGAKAFELSGTPVDCVSLALSGSLFSWTKPTLVVSGITKGLNCGQHSFYSGAVAGAREAVICGVPSISISIDWKKDKSQESDFKDAANICLPFIRTAISDIEEGLFPNHCLLSLDIPSSPTDNKGYKITKPSQWRSLLSWQAVSGNKHPSSGQYMSQHQSLGIQLAQLGRDASAAGAARRVTAQRKTVEIESVATSGKSENQNGMVKKYFRLELLDKEQGETDEDLDFKAVENGFVAVTPICLPFQVESKIYTSASNWIVSAIGKCKEASEAETV